MLKQEKSTKIYTGRNRAYGGNVEIITLSGIYKMYVSVHFISGAQII
jgi:hypothetical protein